MESNLQEQIPLVHELLGALKISYYEVAGYEADDILGSLAAQACSAWRVARSKNGETTSHKPQATSSVEVIIVSGDRDMFQLINENTKVCVPVKGLSETKIYDEAAVRAEYRVAPCQWVDVKALRGDPSDNYPGVQGIGPKTAAELIAKYGTLENLYDRLGDLGKLGVRLAEGAESAGLSKKLAAIKTDVPVQLDLERAAIMGINWHLGIGYMREKLGFRSIAERIENKTSNPVTQLPNKNKDSKISNKNEQLGLI
jgi:DNA polymerase-1